MKLSSIFWLVSWLSLVLVQAILEEGSLSGGRRGVADGKNLKNKKLTIEQLAPMTGSALCLFLTGSRWANWGVRKKCGLPKCNWDSWVDAVHNETAHHTNGFGHRVVLSYGHNGFGNQLWQHTFAFMVAEALEARLLIAPITLDLSPNHYYPPNTWPGQHAMESLLPNSFELGKQAEDDFDRVLCEKEKFYISDRPVDTKRNQNYTGSFRKKFVDLIQDPEPRCLKFVGYFQNYPMCRDDMKSLWGPVMWKEYPTHPGPNDISIYLRCLPSHYFFNMREYYTSILERLDYDRIWMFMAPECPHGKVNKKSKKQVDLVIRLLRETYNAELWPAPPPGSHENMVTASLLSDLSALSQSKHLIIPVSSWAFWAGILSNATEVHVNAPPVHPLMPDDPVYTYHNEAGKQYFGKYNGKEIVYSKGPAKATVTKDDTKKDDEKKKKKKKEEEEKMTAEAHAETTTASGTSTETVTPTGDGVAKADEIEAENLWTPL